MKTMEGINSITTPTNNRQNQTIEMLTTITTTITATIDSKTSEENHCIK